MAGTESILGALAHELRAKASGANAVSIGLAISDHLDAGNAAIAIEERGEVDVLVLADLTVELGVAIDVLCRARDVKDLLRLLELLAELSFDSLATIR